MKHFNNEFHTLESYKVYLSSEIEALESQKLDMQKDIDFIDRKLVTINMVLKSIEDFHEVPLNT